MQLKMSFCTVVAPELCDTPFPFPAMNYMYDVEMEWVEGAGFTFLRLG